MGDKIKGGIKIWLDEDGFVEKVTDHNDKDITYHPDEKKRMEGVGTRLLTPNPCCWVKTPLGWRCLPCG
jgi:hypothetical protein